MIADFLAAQKDLLAQAEERLELYRDKLDKVDILLKKIELRLSQRCQIFLGKYYPNQKKNVPNEHKMHQTVINYPKCPINIPNGHQI
jgi:hypothetical protein